MAAKKSEDPRLRRILEICCALPEAVHEQYGEHAKFSVRKRTFAYYLDNHHGDGIVCVACKVLPGDNERLIRSDPERFAMPDYIGSRGWVSLRLDTGHVDWDEAAEMIRHSYRLVAPKKLAASMASF